uniref:Kinetochore associated 1 n=1 Tax=Fundulus heteroclitus TaxID=8078 RepID=A0A3Q2TXU1_FUNHE
MATWGDVELLINEDTNTGRLDNVSGEQNGSCLYQVDTLVKISSADKVIGASTHTTEAFGIVIIDKTVILLDQSFQTILLLLHFETDVDAVDVCLEGQFLVVCERNGNLHLIYVPHKRILFTRVWEFLFIFIFIFLDVLSVWDLHFLVMIHCWPELAIHDFELTTECGSASMVAQLVTNPSLTICCCFTFQISSLQIRCLPSMSVCYSLDVSSVSCLVQMKTNMDTIYLVEGICENPENRGEPIASVVVRCFTEALPENRLSRLLHKHMFEEAEKFAIAFDLDLELVYKVKLDFVLEQLASASVGGLGQDVCSELVDEAKTNLMKITDEHYVVNYCLKAPWPTFETTEKMLNHAASLDPSLQIQEALARLATFCSLHGSENFSGVAWIEFLYSTDNLGDVLTHLREGDLRCAQLLWLRYEIALEFDEKRLEEILGAIPEDLPSQDLCPWFRTVFVPFVRRVLPRGQRILAKWLEHKARNLELTEKGRWPQNGLDLAVLGLPSLWTWMKYINELQSLKSLVSNLRQLLDLHQKYNCRLSLSVFEKGSVWSVAFFMLDKVPAPELIATTVQTSVQPYAAEHKLPLDELLLQYIKDLLERCSSQTTTLFTGWEAKAVAVLGCMTDTDLMVDAVLEIMQKAVVPWSNVVEKLVQQYLEMDGPKYELLKESYHMMEIRKLLRGYGIRNFTNKQLYINLLSAAEAECVIERLTSWARLQLEDKFSSVLSLLVADNPLKSMECEHNLVMFKAIAHLQEDFDVFFTPSNYEDPNIRKQIQEHHITAYENTRARRPSKGKALSAPVVANDPDGKTKTISTEAGLRRLGRQLQRTEQELWSDLGLRALHAGKVEKALKIFSELYEHHYNSNTGKVLFTAAKKLCQMLQADIPMVIPEGMDLPAVIHDLACQAITLCNSGKNCIRTISTIQLDLSLEAEKDSYSQLSFQDVFNEDCIVLDPVSVLPVQYEITNCLLPIPHGSNHLQTLVDPLTNMLQMLQECSQLELALRVFVNSYGSCLQHITSNIMDTKLSVLCLLCLWCFGLQVFNWRVVDCDLAVGLCTLLPKAEVFKLLWKVIDNTWQNYDKILAVAEIGANLCSLYNEPEEQKKFLSVITDAEWGVKLGKLGVTLFLFLLQIHFLLKLYVLLKKNIFNFSKRLYHLILKMAPLSVCSAFGLDRDCVINQYITTMLLLQEDDDSSTGDAGSGPDEGQPIGDEEVLERVLQIIPMLNSSSELTSSLCAALFKLSPYNYERIEVVLKILEAADVNVTAFSISQVKASLLQHLKSYKRVSPPSDVENVYLLENGLLPNPLSSSRLPFHLLMQTKHFWKIISPELSEETFPTLLLISKLLKVRLDSLYMSAANHVFEKMKPSIFEQRKKGQSHGKEILKVTETMRKYIECIQNLEWAVATAHKIAQELPAGSEKTQFLQFCLGLGEMWLKDPNLEERGRGETFVSKLKLQFQRSATENVLISSQLSSPELLKLTGQPARLIVTLYEHSSVEQRYRETAGQTFPDLHAAVREIATINNVDLVKIRNMLMEKWICKTGPAVTKPPGMLVSAKSVFLSMLDSCRVVYMLQSYPVNDPLSSSGPRLTSCHRARVLLCLIRLADAVTLEAQLQIPRSKLKYYLKAYIFVSQLEALNSPYTVQSFLNSPKEGLVKGLWKNHSHEPQAVRLVADLCLEYQVYDPQLWNSLLQKLLGFNLVSHLQKVLEAIVAVPTLWEVLLQLTTLTHLKIKTPILCPFLLNLDLIGIANRFAQFNLPAFALGTLLLIPCATKRAQQIQGFLSLSNPVAILEQVDELMNTGELAGIPSQIRGTVLKFIGRHGQHQQLMKTKHFDRLKQLVASGGQPGQVKELVEFLISQNW